MAISFYSGLKQEAYKVVVFLLSDYYVSFWKRIVLFQFQFVIKIGFKIFIHRPEAFKSSSPMPTKYILKDYKRHHIQIVEQLIGCLVIVLKTFCPASFLVKAGFSRIDLLRNKLQNTCTRMTCMSQSSMLKAKYTFLF